METPMNQFEKFDLIVIGCGPAGYAGAMRAMDINKKVAIIEKNEIGGAGVLWGALTSKCLWELSKDYAGASRVDRGFRCSSLEVKFTEVRKTVMTAAKEKQYQMLSQLESYHPNVIETEVTQGSIEYFKGQAKLKDKNHVSVFLNDGGEVLLHADHILIATGSRPRPFPGIPFEDRRIVNSSSLLSLTKFPNRLLIVGAGIIGCEYATIFSNFKQTEVHLLDRADRILPFEDRDISAFIDENLKDNDVNIIHESTLREVRHKSSGMDVVIDHTDGHNQVIEVDCILMSIGRIPNTDHLNLEAVNISPDQRGQLNGELNCKLTDNIFAAGDITPGGALVNIAEMEARFSVKTMYNLERVPLEYRNMSTIMFFKPEVAAVGLNERNCREQGIPYRVAYYSNKLVNRAISMRATRGFVKILVDSDNKILGMRAAGPQASSLVMCITLLMDSEQTIDEIIKTIHPHPSMTEGIQECIRLLLDKSIYKPHCFPKLMSKGSWSPETGERQG